MGRKPTTRRTLCQIDPPASSRAMGLQAQGPPTPGRRPASVRRERWNSISADPPRAEFGRIRCGDKIDAVHVLHSCVASIQRQASSASAHAAGSVNDAPCCYHRPPLACWRLLCGATYLAERTNYPMNRPLAGSMLRTRATFGSLIAFLEQR